MSITQTKNIFKFLDPLYLEFPLASVVGLVFQCIVEIKGGYFSLKGKEMEGIQDIKGECSAWALQRSRHPPRTQKLYATMGCPATFAETDGERIDTTRVHNGEVLDGGTRQSTGTIIMADHHPETDVC